MSAHNDVLEAESSLSALKDFQRDTVDYVFRRMWLDPDRTHRFLVADEVGLGKTMVARGVIAKTIEYLKQQEIERIDVVYICSNAEIARQNIARLSCASNVKFTPSSRITLLPTLIRDLAKNRINLISFTPNTSFELGRSEGMARERVLLYRMLRGAWQFGGTAPEKNVFLGSVRDVDRFRGLITEADRSEPIDETLARRFRETLASHDAARRARRELTLREEFDQLLDLLPRAGSALPRDVRIARTGFVGALRQQLATACVNALEPDLVVLDEFQRFKHLLGAEEGDDNPAAELAQVLFDFETREDLGKTRVLLLSATPYRMFTMAGETEGDDHYADFVDTLRFLQDHPDRSNRAEELLRQYKGALFQLPEDGGVSLRQVKAELESELRRVIVRTERLGASVDRNGMLKEMPATGVGLEARDALAYRETQRLASQVGHADPIEYWKGAPYLLSFARGYALSEALEDDELDDATRAALRATIQQQRHLHVPPAVRRGDQAVDPPHSRLRWLLDDISANGLWDMCWLPPSLPYYALGGGFSRANVSTSKRLIFSSWRMVPRAIAVLVSLEAERRMFRDARRVPLPDAPEKISPPLVFTLRGGQPSRMSTMTMVYPSFTLAELGDPLAVAHEFGSGLSVEEALKVIRDQLAPAIESITRDAQTDGREDDRWYWAAPVLLDLGRDRVETVSWTDRNFLSFSWVGEDHVEVGRLDTAVGNERGWEMHVRQIRNLALGSFEKLGKPPADLLEIMALVAVASPAVCALRALTRDGEESGARSLAVRDAAAAVAHEIRALFNVPEIAAMLRGSVDDEEAYWRIALRYAAEGGLQAVLDEWAHVLTESEGLVDVGEAERAGRLGKAMRSALVPRAAMVNAVRHSVRDEGIKATDERYRSRFALRFGDRDSVDDDGTAMRTSQVRAAFNSPFWPFVLASTTVGQEGLDFHPYCHAVVHWNLPHNPVDLEQREGRVHRYKGHAVRKNVARAFGAKVIGERARDPWSRMFTLAASARPQGTTDINPYWVFALDDGARIERHVPSIPLSRDRHRLEQLRKSLVLYRMVFGQPRQDELVQYLARVLPPDAIQATVDTLRIDLMPPSREASGQVDTAAD